MNRPADYLLHEVNKRLTLNLLIQGSAQHAFLTSHYLVRDELNAINPKLLHLYDQFAAASFVQYWAGEMVLTIGRPDRFWRRVSRPSHPFHRHPLLSRHGLSLMKAAKERAYERCREKGVWRIPGVFSFHLLGLVFGIMKKEAKHKPALIDLAKTATSEAWGIPYWRLSAELTRMVVFGQPRTPTTVRGAYLRAGAAGFGGVLSKFGTLWVIARGWIWPIVSHELVKGTVELICMHGLNHLDEATYKHVVHETDRIEYEPWMLQVGSELWRQLLPLLPNGRPIAEIVMHIARLPAQSLESLMLEVVEDKDRARRWLADLGREENRDG